MTRITRRGAIASVGTALAAAGGASVVTGTTDAASVLEMDRESDYPRCVYQPDGDEWTVTMPINMHVTVPGKRRAVAAIEAEFVGLENPRWTRLFPDAETAAWDGNDEKLVEPDVSVRRPRLGEGWNHVHVWDVDADRAAVHAHFDVIDLEYEYLHRGARYDAAARQVRTHLSADDWRRKTPYSIEYGVDEGKREDWGATGDTKLEYVPG